MGEEKAWVVAWGLFREVKTVALKQQGRSTVADYRLASPAAHALQSNLCRDVRKTRMFDEFGSAVLGEALSLGMATTRSV